MELVTTAAPSPARWSPPPSSPDVLPLRVDDRIVRVPLIRLAAPAPSRAAFPLNRQFERTVSPALARPPPDPVAELPRRRQRVMMTVPAGLQTAPPSPLAALASSVQSTSSTRLAIELGR